MSAQAASALRNEQVELSLLAARHRDLYQSLYGSSEVMRTVARPLTTQEIDEQLGKVVHHNGLVTPGHRAWAISVKWYPEPVGLAALMRTGDRAEFGMMLIPVAWRRGLSRGVIGALLPHAFGAMGLAHIDVSRRNDDYVEVLDRMFAPFRFRRRAGLRPGDVGWTLAADEWRMAAAGAGELAPRA